MEDRLAGYEEWARSFAVRRLGVLLWIGVVGWATYLVSDAAALGWQSDVVRYRMAGELVLVATLLIHRTRLVRRYFDATFVLTMCAMTFTTLLVVVPVEGAGSDRVGQASLLFQSGRFGISLLFVAAAVIVPMRLRAHLVVQVLSVLFFGLHHAETFAVLSASSQLAPMLLGLFWVCFVCDFSIHLYSRLQRSEFLARRELEEVARAQKSQLDALEEIGITATSAVPEQQTRAALDEIIRVLGLERAWLYLLDDAGRLGFRMGRNARGDEIGEPTGDEGEIVELPLRMRERRIGAIRLEGRPAATESSEDRFLQAVASHVAIALETVRTTEALRSARDEALAAARAKDAFLRTMTHELRTPLNAMIGYSEMLQEDLEDIGNAQQAADAGRVHAAAVRLLGVIGDILDLTDLEAGRHALDASSFEVAELVGELEASLRPLAETNGNRLEVAVAEDMGPIHTDRKRLAKILHALLENACQFTRQGKVVCEVDRTQREGAPWLRFRVHDTGIGMNEEQLARCFEPFYQADSSATREHEGAGLGLATARGLAELLGGELRARSAPGEGTTFELGLPAA